MGIPVTNAAATATGAVVLQWKSVVNVHRGCGILPIVGQKYK